MNLTRRFFLLLPLALAISSGCAILKPSTDDSASSVPPADREFRGVWVATVSNIDWPSKPGLSTDEQKREALVILDSAVALHLNAIVFQVRPHCDAMYESSLEPWSYYLTGTQGLPPEPYYDPLSFWVEESHKRGLELHAWFNPYRAQLPRGGEIGDSSIVKKRPHLAKLLPNGTYWLDPANKETQDHSYAVVMDVVRRYNVDGIHFDDYFYPYGDGSFPDDDTWNAYKATNGSMTREDWRRDAVNTFVRRVYQGIKNEKPFVKFGLSPFGIWRPGYPASIQGFDQYNGLYADAKLWLNKGWVDYWTPQLYWPVNQIPQSFPVLLGWWTKENTQGRNIWPGMIVGRATSEKGADEIMNQIMITRGFVPEGPGQVHFSMKAFLRDSSALNEGLKNGPYQREALVPPSPWLDDEAPSMPLASMTVANDTATITWTHPNAADVFRWVVYYQYNTSWQYTILNAGDRTKVFPLSRVVKDRPRARRGQEVVVQERTETLMQIAVSAVDRVGNESSKVVVPVVMPVASK
jgi:uncharacterized lipoprotein YddW (UPF0748 family)